MKFRRLQSIFYLLLAGSLFLTTSCTSPTKNDDTATLIRMINESGYNFTEVNTNFFMDDDEIELNYQNLADGSISDYQEIPANLLHKDGFYCTYANAFSDSLGIWLTLGRLCHSINPNKTVPLAKGEYSFILEFVPAEILDLSLNTHREYASDTTDVLIRVQNNSEKDFLKVKVRFPSDGDIDPVEIDYGSVSSSQSSEYTSVQLAYRYASITAITSNDTLQWEPIDYVGETPLSPGEYSYALDIIVSPKDVSRIVKD